MNYEEKQAFKLERYQELSQKAETESQNAYNRSSAISDAIPMGQPILIGHHSEGRHRRDISRIHNLIDKSIEEKEKAEYYKKKAENILNPSSISSDNPEAVTLLKEKLTGLEAKREKIKEYNKEQRKKGELGADAYILANLSGNIKSVKDRIQYLERLKLIPETEETINGVLIKTDKEANRIKLFFPDIPKEEIRTKLKHNGFRWSPFGKCWQSYLKQWNIDRAREIISEVV